MRAPVPEFACESMQTFRKLGALTSILVAMASGCAQSPSPPRADPAASVATGAGAHGLANGFYAVLREEASAVFLDRSTYVPLILDRPPEGAVGADGRPMLGITLASRYVKVLEDFTRAHLGGRMAIVFGEEIVSVHKVRSVIEGGQMKITRCTLDERDQKAACETIRSKLDVEDAR